MAGEPYSNKVDSSLDRIPFDIVKLLQKVFAYYIDVSS